ncbi:MAG: PepSY domain-containing protein [Methylotenera sp.]|nr:PepSY domain-containing protein [Methylotenera sp.]
MNNTRLNHLKKRRALWLNIHLWLGLSMGLLLSVVALTGSISVFYQELDQWLNPGVLSVELDHRGVQAYRPLQEILDAANKVAQQDYRHTLSIQAPRVSDSTYGIGYVKPENKVTNTPETWVSIRVNPYTAQVTGIRTFPLGAGLPPGLVDFIAVLHYRLLLDDFWGGSIVGFLGIFGLFSTLTGMILWWPLTGKWRQAFTFKKTSNQKRINIDVHKLVGMYFCVVLGAVLLSGIYMNFNDKFVGLVQVISPQTNQMPIVKVGDLHSNIGLAKAAQIVESAHPEGEFKWMVDDASNGKYLFSRHGVASTSHFWAERIVTVEAQTGRIVHVRDATNRKTAGETFLDWQWPLHSGKAFGWAGRILVFISGLIVPILFVTGVIRWLQKRKIQRKSSRNIAHK